MKKGGKRKLHERPAEFAVAARMHALGWWKEQRRCDLRSALFDSARQMPAHPPKLPPEFKRANNPHTCRHSW